MARRAPLLAPTPMARLRRRLRTSPVLTRLGGGGSSDEPETDGGDFLRARLRRRSIPLPLVLGLAGGCWILVTLIAGDHGWLRIRALRREHARVEQQIGEAETQIASLRRQLARTGDPVHLERVAREEFGLARPGEVVYRRPAAPEP